MAISFIGSTDANAINGGNVTLTLPGTPAAGDCVIVAYAVPSAVTLKVTSSNTGTNYTQLLALTSTGTLRLGVFRRILPAAETTAICTGSGLAADGNSGAVMVFRGVDPGTPEAVTSTSSTGTGTTPDSPSITIPGGISGVTVISAVGSLISDTTVTAPSGYSGQADNTGSDTVSTTIGAAYNSTLSGAVDPGSWTNFTSALWLSATIAVNPASTIWQQRHELVPLPAVYNAYDTVAYD